MEKDLSLDGLGMQAECLRKDSPNKLYLPKQMGKDRLGDLELDGPITLRTRWSNFGWNHLGLHPSKTMDIWKIVK